jgi:uncharacterized membrane protein
MEPAALGVLIVFVSFAIDRIASASIYLLATVQVFTTHKDAVESARGLRVQSILYYVIALVLAWAFIQRFPSALILSSLKVATSGPDWMDKLVTIIVLVGGADRFASVFQSGHKTATAESRDKPIEITGRVEVIGTDKPAGR